MNHTTSRDLFWLLALGVAWRSLLAWLTPVPAEDGVNYLWMAVRFAQADAGAALSEVFPPLPSLLFAVPVWLGLEPFRAAQLVLVVAGALAVVPAVRIVESWRPELGRIAGVFFALAPLPARFAGEVYSEPLFLLLGGAAFLAGLRRRWWLCGALVGAGFQVRPEALLIAATFTLLHWRRALAICALPALAVLGLALLRVQFGSDFELLPKAGFNWSKSALGAGDAGAVLTRLGGNLIDVPWLWVEAFAGLGLLAVVGLARRPRPAPAVLLLVLAIVVIVAFVPRRRFLVSWTFAVLPLAMLGYDALPRRARVAALLLVVASSIGLGLRVTAADRLAERDVGAFLGEQLAPSQTLTGDMTRVLYFAGRRPLPPRHFTADEIVAAASAPDVRFVVLGANRPHAAEVEQRLRDAFEVYELPPALRELAAARGIVVLARR